MSQNLLFDIKVPEGHMVQFEQEATFENFIGQFQLFCPKLLCVVDGTSLRYYDKPGTLPTNIRFDYKQRRNKLTEYYFRDIDNDSLYCVFGRDAAKIFYPRIDDVDPSGVSEYPFLSANSDVQTPHVQPSSHSNSQSTLVPPVPIPPTHSTQSTQSTSLQPPLSSNGQRPAIINESTNSSHQPPNTTSRPQTSTVNNPISKKVSDQLPIPVGTSSIKQTNPSDHRSNNASISLASHMEAKPAALNNPENQKNSELLRRDKQASDQENFYVPKDLSEVPVNGISAFNLLISPSGGSSCKPGCKPKRPTIIQRIPAPNVVRNDISTVGPQVNTMTRVISNRSKAPDNIVIIDKGVKLTFPNPNYPIEVKTYQPQ